MKRTLWALVAAMVVAAAASPALAAGAVGMMPDQQYRFAEQLAAQGECLLHQPRRRRMADGRAVQGEAGGYFTDTGGAFGDNDELDDNQDDKDYKPDGK